MTSRKGFVAAAAASLGALNALPALAQTGTPQPSPSPSPAPSAAALAFAARMRAFDPHLSDAQIEAIAAGIDGNWQLGKTVNANGTALVNSDEPVPGFSVR